VARAEAYLHVKFHLNPSDHLVTIHQRHRQTDRQDRQTDRQRSDSIGRTVLQTVAHKRFTICYRTVVLSCLSVCNVGVLLPSGCMVQNETWHGGRLGPGHIVLDGDPAPLQKGGTASSPPQKKSWPMSVVAKRID